MTNKVKVEYNFPILGLLGIVFIVLKLCGVIAWSWWWVTAPLWIPFAIFAVIAIAVFFYLVVRE